MRVNWTKEQDERAVAAYFEMWRRVRAGEKVNKAATYRTIGAEIGREAGGVEQKFQNISAVLNELGSLDWLPGLRPRPNYQELLADSVLEWLNGDVGLLTELLSGLAAPGAQTAADQVNHAEDEVEPPKSDSPLVQAVAGVVSGRHPRVLDFLELNQRNRELGDRGEEFVVERERRRLYDVVKAPGLAQRVEWVSKTHGDGLGYDVASFEPDGSPLLIEVKTTTLGKCTPFFVSRNELSVSRREPTAYQLYRLFDFSRRPRFYRLRGPLDQSCVLEAQSFSARAGSR